MNYCVAHFPLRTAHWPTFCPPVPQRGCPNLGQWEGGSKMVRTQMYSFQTEAQSKWFQWPASYPPVPQRGCLHLWQWEGGRSMVRKENYSFLTEARINWRWAAQLDRPESAARDFARKWPRSHWPGTEPRRNCPSSSAESQSVPGSDRRRYLIF